MLNQLRQKNYKFAKVLKHIPANLRLKFISEAIPKALIKAESPNDIIKVLTHLTPEEPIKYYDNFSFDEIVSLYNKIGPIANWTDQFSQEIIQSKKDISEIFYTISVLEQFLASFSDNSKREEFIKFLLEPTIFIKLAETVDYLERLFKLFSTYNHSDLFLTTLRKKAVIERLKGSIESFFSKAGGDLSMMKNNFFQPAIPNLSICSISIESCEQIAYAQAIRRRGAHDRAKMLFKIPG